MTNPITVSNTRLAESALMTRRRTAKDWTLDDLDQMREFVTSSAANLLDHLLVLRALRETEGRSRNTKVKMREKREVRVTVELL